MTQWARFSQIFTLAKETLEVFILFLSLNMSLFFIKEENEGSTKLEEDKDFN